MLTGVSSPRATITPDAGILLLAGVNGWVVRLLAGDGVSLSLFGPLALSVALISICTEDADASPPWLLGIAGLLILIPSGSAAWLAMAVLAAFSQWPPVARLLALGLATAELFATVGLNIGKAFILPTEAQMASSVLELAGLSPHVFGNAIELYDRFTIVAAGCSGVGGAVFAGLAVAAIVWWRVPETKPRLLIPLIVLTMLGAFSINIFRIALMAVNAEFYEFAHAQNGAFIADLLSALVVVTFASLAERSTQ